MIVTTISVLVILFLGIDVLLCVVMHREWRRNAFFRIDMICSRRISHRIIRSGLDMLERRPGFYLTSIVMGYCAIGVALYHFA